MDSFDGLPEQQEAKRLLRAALKDGPAHAYLFHGSPGVGKRRAALAFATELLGDERRVRNSSHPDLYLLEPVGDQIRIDEIRELRHDLHMRPFEASRRVYLVWAADTMNEDAADALLKDLEEPPLYATIVLVASELGPLPETIRSRCQLVPFRRLSERAVREAIAARAPALTEEEVTALARVAAGRLDRAERLLDAKGAARRAAVIEVARAAYADAGFEPADAAARVLDGVQSRGTEERERAAEHSERLDLTAKDSELRLRRAQRGAEREELLASLEELASWYRDLVVVAVGAARAAANYDRLEDLTADATRERLLGAERAAEIVRETWRAFEEFNINPPLALEALFVKLRRELAGPVVA